MATEKGIQTYFLTITILPQKSGLNLRNLIHGINDTFENFAGNVKVVYKFKVSGEARVIAVVDVPYIVAFENFIEALWDLGSVDISSVPLLHYDIFARNLGVAEDIASLPDPVLLKDNLYWLEFEIDYQGKTLDAFLDLWKREAEYVLTPRARGETTLIPYKTLGQRKVHVFINNPFAGKLDKATFELPIVIENGHNIQARAKGVQFLVEYIKDHPLKK
ncbi:unnamed protein product [Candidula unifasciata]|uniref:Uncharacterized protein n=1 Tax=Candidula unifasciata TaxID=100452 RepID=A0A8S3Z671_9EUPU|nr:unnamed protein product [Candidula unifasciata]